MWSWGSSVRRFPGVYPIIPLQEPDISPPGVFFRLETTFCVSETGGGVLDKILPEIYSTLPLGSPLLHIWTDPDRTEGVRLSLRTQRGSLYRVHIWRSRPGGYSPLCGIIGGEGYIQNYTPPTPVSRLRRLRRLRDFGNSYYSAS